MKPAIRMIAVSVIIAIIVLLTNISPICAQTRTESTHITDLLQTLSVDSINMHIEQLCYADGYQSRVSYTPGNYASAEYIASYFESLPGISRVTRDTFYLAVANDPYDEYPLVNIVATLEGNSEDAGIAIVGAHYDASGSNDTNYSGRWQTIKAQGADDNATGVASVMELARVLSNPSSHFQNIQTIDFIAFAAEEYHPVHPSYHHLGSIYDAQKRDKANENVIGALILDMIAYNPNTEYIEVISDLKSLWMADLVYENAASYIPGLALNDTPVDVPYSDHQSYQDYGFSSILLMENDLPWNDDWPYYTANPVYHTADDTIGLLNTDQLNLVAKLALATLADSAFGQVSTPVLADHKSVRPVSSLEIVSVKPNPFNSRVLVEINAGRESVRSVEIFNILGERVADLSGYYQQKGGRFSIRWDAANLPSGMYLCAIRTEKSLETVKLVLTR